MLYANYIGLLLNNSLYIFKLIIIFSLLFFIFTIFFEKKKMVSITNSVIFLFELELKQFKLSKILPIWEIAVYIVLIIKIN